jgi:hypothetical protein
MKNDTGSLKKRLRRAERKLETVKKRKARQSLGYHRNRRLSILNSFIAEIFDR